MNSLALGLDRGPIRPKQILIDTLRELPKLDNLVLLVGIYSLSGWYKISGRPRRFVRLS
jgi:hypothetical protein